MHGFVYFRGHSISQNTCTASLHYLTIVAIARVAALILTVRSSVIDVVERFGPQSSSVLRPVLVL